MILDIVANPDSEGLNIGIDISFTSDQPNQSIDHFSPKINEEQS